MREYIVIARSEADIDSLHEDLVNITIARLEVDKESIPSRKVEVANERLGNPYITHYYLTDQEAEELAKDPRVVSVHLPPAPDSKRRMVVQKSKSYNGIFGNFKRNSAKDKYNINWGLRRTSLVEAESTLGNTYSYENSGAGVDIVIMDDGIQIDHPEFKDPSGASRVQRIDWYAATGIPGKMPLNHYKIKNYGDAEHGTHVAAIAAGKTFGYAKNSRIYLIRIFGDQSQVIPDPDIFDLIRVWHSKKPIDPVTKTKRPTVVNMSWGFAWYYRNTPYSNFPIMTGVNFRNNEKKFDVAMPPSAEFGQIGTSGSIHGLVVPSFDVEQQLAEDEGVIFVRAAGNYSNKIDNPNGIDFNNYYTTNKFFAGMIPPGQPIYYHRGGSPRSNNTIVVAAARDKTTLVKKKPREVLDSYSERGPGCDVVAPGTNITSATSKLSSYEKMEYVWGKNSSVDRSHRVSKVSGTSMAAPQVTGILALYLSQNPAATPAETKAWINSVAIKNQVFDNTAPDSWNNLNSLLGGSNNYLYNPFHNGHKNNRKT